MKNSDSKNLKKRYLLWLYKTTKEALDKIERRFTQLEIDRFILQELKRKDRGKNLKKFIAQWQAYILNKEKDSIALKYSDCGLSPEYRFMLLKLKAIEKAIIRELGNKALAAVKELYQQEMLRRILQEREEKR
jgi:hypothetical protein